MYGRNLDLHRRYELSAWQTGGVHVRLTTLFRTLITNSDTDGFEEEIHEAGPSVQVFMRWASSGKRGSKALLGSAASRGKGSHDDNENGALS